VTDLPPRGAALQARAAGCRGSRNLVIEAGAARRARTATLPHYLLWTGSHGDGHPGRWRYLATGTDFDV